MYQHNVPKLDGNLGYTAEEADNYNKFYGTYYESSIQAVLNQEPSIVKMFNTLNYEGSQTYVKIPDTIEDVNINNAIAWNNTIDVLGWECSEIKTDLDYGSVKEFIKKEGKWFNYIKGLNTDIATINTSLFSVQGVGIITEVETI